MIDRLIKKIIDMQNPTCVGLDTGFEYLPDNMREDMATFEGAAEEITEFNMNIEDKISDIVPAIKVQVAYYEMYGYEGLKAFNYTINYALGRGMIVIADCKRNDIGSTAGCYAKAFLGSTRINEKTMRAFPADMLTVNGYLGTDGIEPFLKECRNRDKSLFVLVKTSNPSSGELQNRDMEGKPLYARMAEMVAKWGDGLDTACGYNQIGAVVGATYPEEQKIVRELLPKSYFLVPGYGAQGGQGKDLVHFFNEDGLGAIVNSSRGIIAAYKQEAYAKFGPENFGDASRAAVEAMIADISSALESK